MRKIMALLLVLLMVISVTACGDRKENPGATADSEETLEESEKEEKPAQKKPTPEEESSDPVTEESADPGTEESKVEEPETITIPDLDAYEFPADHPHEGKDLTVYDGLYRAEYLHENGAEIWVRVTGYNDFILLEFQSLIDGEIDYAWVEEFWPEDGWYTDTDIEYTSGKCQSYSSMADYENYSELPQKRGIGLTEEGILLDWGANEAEFFIRDTSYTGGHSTAEELRASFGDAVHLDFEYQYDSRNAVGNWAAWNGNEAVNLVLDEDGTFKMFRKSIGKPVEVYEGVYGFGRNSGNLVIAAERAGFGLYPYEADWEWSIDEFGFLNISDDKGVLFDGSYSFWKVETEFFTVMNVDTALGYVIETVHADGDYTDQYGTDYIYYYSLPEFHDSENQELEAINDLIYEFYMPIIEEEMRAMDIGEFISYDHVDWEVDAYKGVLFLHVYAYTYDWEEHSIFYIDTETMTPMDPAAMLERIGLSKEEFLETVRARAEEVFIITNEGIPEEEREVYGYYECLEETLSDAFINLDLPVYVDHYGDIRVYLKLSSMAGTGVQWVPDYPFGMTDAGEGIG